MTKEQRQKFEQGARVVNLSKLNDTLIDASELSQNKRYHLQRCADKWDNEKVGNTRKDEKLISKKDSLKNKSKGDNSPKRVQFNDDEVKVTKHKKTPNPNFKPKTSHQVSESDETDTNIFRMNSN